jgi:hypothetical protein
MKTIQSEKKHQKLKLKNKTTMKVKIGQKYKVYDGETTVTAYLLTYTPHLYRFRSVQTELDFEIYQTDLDTGVFSVQPLSKD